MLGDTTSDEEGSQEDSPRYDIDNLEIIKTIGEPTSPIDFDTNWCRSLENFLFYYRRIRISVCTLEQNPVQLYYI